MRTRTSVLAALAVAIACLASAGLRAAESLADLGEGEGEKRKSLDALQGKPAPALQLKDWANGQPVTLADLKGKIVVLDFWATWCGPCIASIPHNNELAAKYQEQGVVFLGVCHPRGMENMGSVVTDKGLKYPTAKDPGGATIKAYQVDSFPDYYVIDRAGNLRVADCKNDKVEAAIQLLLKEH